MKIIGRFLQVALLGVCVFPCQAWNALGHRLIGQIAYNHLEKSVKSNIDKYNQALDTVYHHDSFVNAGPWMDSLRYVKDVWMKPFHYIDIPFSTDGTPLSQPEEANAVTAIVNAERVLSDKKSSEFDKGFSARILLHVVGDIHQPMHAVSQYSQQHPKGDLGGNLFVLGSNSVASNLHAYWDVGGGLLQGGQVNDETLRQMAEKIEAKWPCDVSAMVNNPTAWSEESFQLAVDKAYQLQPTQRPSANYQATAQTTSEQRIALAGCRLAKTLNERVMP